MNLIEAIYGVLFSPTKTLREIGENKIWLSGILIFFIVMSFNMVLNLGMAGIEPIEQVLPFSANFIWLGGLIGIIFSIIVLFVTAGLYALLGEIIYKSSNAAGLLAAFSFASLPSIFAAPTQYLANLANLNLISSLIAILIGIWVIILQVIALRESLRLSTSQAIVLYIIPLITSILLIGIIVLAATSTLMLYK